MKLKDIGEFGLIEKITPGCLIRPDNVIKAIGDDAAVFTTEQNAVTLVTTDLLVERVHFLRDAASGVSLGHKALAVNLSDIAAMGGDAKEAFVSIAIPEDCPVDYIEDLYTGMKALAEKYEVNILGGDTTHSKTDLIINVAVTGSVSENEVLLRSDARPGDLIVCTGVPGESKAGLHLILNDQPIDSDAFKHLIDVHVLPEPHLHEGRFLAKRPGTHACIDMSDGLTSDLGHILKQSGVGARLSAQKLPASKSLKIFCEAFDFDPIDYALSGGEDYILISTLSPDSVESTAGDFKQAFNRPLYVIGIITESTGMILEGADGQVKEIFSTGWDHFKKG